MEQESSSDITRNTADFWSRAMALLIDWTLLFFFELFLVGLLGNLYFFDLSLNLIGFAVGLILLFLVHVALFPLIVFLYFVVLHCWGGKTIGKIFMGIRVVSRQDDALTAGDSFLRFAGYLLSAFPIGAGFLWAVLDKEHSAWHDILAGSRVVYD